MNILFIIMLRSRVLAHAPRAHLHVSAVRHAEFVDGADAGRGRRVHGCQYAYGYSRFSFPGSAPLFSGRVPGAQPVCGDVVVFRLPRDTSTDYVKRVVGLPATAFR